MTQDRVQVSGNNNSTISGDYNIIGDNNKIEVIDENLLRELLSTIGDLRSELSEIRQELRNLRESKLK